MSDAYPVSCSCVFFTRFCFELTFGVNMKVVDNFVSFPMEPLRAHALECFVIQSVEGSCPGVLIIQPLRAHALECFVIQSVEGSCPGMLIIQSLRAHALECLVIQIVGGLMPRNA
ncbi:hypothetical protein MTR_1g012050 [Medicago truncatula]|uniref:Uncharacterized protein n=1 Tax=Medicago truncatula TaxID=3880 RepID=G7I6F4_MEDTR|nr:hypothetical protein MTR_1g012050 [Medicago truncatula]